MDRFTGWWISYTHCKSIQWKCFFPVHPASVYGFIREERASSKYAPNIQLRSAIRRRCLLTVPYDLLPIRHKWIRRLMRWDMLRLLDSCLGFCFLSPSIHLYILLGRWQNIAAELTSERHWWVIQCARCIDYSNDSNCPITVHIGSGHYSSCSLME